MDEKKHVGRPTNEEVANRKKKRNIKIIGIIFIIFVVIGGLFIVLNKENIEFSAIMGNSSIRSTIKKIQNNNNYAKVTYAAEKKDKIYYHKKYADNENINYITYLFEKAGFSVKDYSLVKIHLYRNGGYYRTYTKLTKDFKVPVKYAENTLVLKVYGRNKKNKKTQYKYLRLYIQKEIISDSTKLLTPTLSIPQGSKGEGKLYLGFSIGVEGAYSTKDSLGQIKGYEFYEKIGNEYKLLSDHKITYNKTNDFYQMDANNIIFDVGENRNFVARTYTMNNQGKKVYSAYSNVVNVNNKVETPTLTNASGSKDKGIISANLNIVTQGYYADLNNKSQISGFELYEKTGNEYKLVDTKLITANPFNVNVTVNAGETKIYVARAFATNKNGKKVYSVYSNEVKIDN